MAAYSSLRKEICQKYFPIVKIFHRKAGEKPSKTTEDESFNETDDVEQSPTLDSNAVAGKEDCDGAVDGDRHGEHQEPSSVAETNTVVDVGTMMVKLSHAPVTDPAAGHRQ